MLIGSGDRAASQLLDPGWQVVGGADGVYAVQPAPMAYPPITYSAMAPPRAYQPGPVYYQPMPAQRAYQPAPMYFQPAPAPQQRGFQQLSVSYQQAAVTQPRGFQPAPVYYAPMPQHQTSAAQQPPIRYLQAPAPMTAMQPAPVSSWHTLLQQAPNNAPRYYASASPAQARGFLSTPSVAAAPPVSVSQPPAAAVPMTASMPQQTVPAAPQSTPATQPPSAPQRQRGFFSTLAPQQTARATDQTGSVTQPSAFGPPVRYAQVAPAQQLAFGYQQQGFGYQQPDYQQQPQGYQQPQVYQPQGYAPSSSGDMAHPVVDPRYDRQAVAYDGDEAPGTIIIDTPHYFLYLVMEDHKAIRYGIGVGRQGFTWSGVKQVSAMREWPDWIPPQEMLERRPDLPRFMPGGPDNPLGARALYLGSTLYRIHGSNEPWTIGTQVSSGCIRLRNADVIDLYGRVKVGTKVVVM